MSAIKVLLSEELALSPEVIERGNFLSRGGLDSFDRIRFIVLLEERFQLQLELSSVVPERFSSISSIAELIMSSKSRDGGDKNINLPLPPSKDKL
jgi:acyl carrier protein